VRWPPWSSGQRQLDFEVRLDALGVVERVIRHRVGGRIVKLAGLGVGVVGRAADDAQGREVDGLGRRAGIDVDRGQRAEAAAAALGFSVEVASAPVVAL
jgi:hypothetical protein